MKVYRLFVMKKEPFDLESNGLLKDLREQLNLEELEDLRVINRYDISDIDRDTLEKGVPIILSEPMVDDVYFEDLPFQFDETFAIEYLPGQYDQRADASKQCYSILTGDDKVNISCAKVIGLKGNLKDEDVKKIKDYLINPVDQRLAKLEKNDSLEKEEIKIEKVKNIDGFINFNESDLENFLKENQMAMSLDDLKLTLEYFRDEEHRDPTETELRVLDTYWSDHCRHTTFSTVLDDITFEDGNFKEILEKNYSDYKKDRERVYGFDTNRPITLMDLATISMKELRKEGLLDDLEVSEEINACSIEIDINTDEGVEKWLLMFKNETHNHPTEIEPFGGAATCLGGAIRDPLSGRSYVYQGMRITGAGNPLEDIKDTVAGKLPQRKICIEAAKGFSSYGNQIGLATGFVKELYHEGFKAKRLELGAVVAAAPKSQVKRLEPKNGNIVLLIGGRTGRDGVGGATGSSKSHEKETTLVSGAEVQKGNPVEERKIQRLFRDEEVAEKIIRCNDFGAGGVSVAIGELAPNLDISLDNILKKYEGLNGTELAISESQERMAVVISKEDKDFIISRAKDENLEVVEVAKVTDSGRLIMNYMDQKIVDLSREFIEKNGAKRHQNVFVALPDFERTPFKQNNIEDKSFKKVSKEILSKLGIASQKGLVERFDSSIGNLTVISPYGGKTFRTEAEGMCALIPVLGKETKAASLMTFGYNPDIASWSPYHGSYYAVIESIAKIVAMGGDYHKIRFSFQEYFEKLGKDPLAWGKPFSALLAAFSIENKLKLPSIGGKDSMSGTFEDLKVPPTLVSFAITALEATDVITPELKEAGHKIVEIWLKKDDYELLDLDELMKSYDEVMKLMKENKVYSSYTVKSGGIIEALYKSAFGNSVGVDISDNISLEDLTEAGYGNILLEVDLDTEIQANHRIIGTTTDREYIRYADEELNLDEAYSYHEGVMEKIYPARLDSKDFDRSIESYELNFDKRTNKKKASKTYEDVNVVIPVFPGTNCEYDSKRAFEKAGAKVELVIIKNKEDKDIENSVIELEKAIDRAQILMLPGGFSAGDEPDGSGKFIATFLRNPRLEKAINNLIEKRDGLIIGICNGFQALIKLGLLPDGKIKDMTEDDATLTFNDIRRHVSQMALTRISSVNSPWLNNVEVGEVFTIPVSHGEGKFVASKEKLEELIKNGQIFSQYVDFEGKVTMEFPFNPNGSMMAIEGIISKDGRVIGKMAHSERQGEHRNKNIYGKMDQKIFEAGVNYFKDR